MSSNAVKSAQLGMPWGTAMHRLRKSIIFQLIQKTGQDICVRCSGIIDNIDDMSIEHIRPWLFVSPDLFWDLDNIGFSHVECNKPHRYPGNPGVAPPNKILCPNGTNWCSRCRLFLPLERFSKNPTKRNGVQDYCINCRSEYRKSRKRG